MARERRASGKTSFGKRTPAEKNFRDRETSRPKREDSGSDEEPRKRSFSGRGEKPFARKSFGKPSFRSRDSDDSNKKSFSKPGFRKNDSDRFSKFKKDEPREERGFSRERKEKP